MTADHTEAEPAEAIFHQDGELYVPTHLAQGPWYAGAQHGGAIVGLAAHIAEQAPAAVPMHPARITTELFRSVPMKPLRPRLTHVREGKRIQLLQVSLWDSNETVELARANVLRIRCAPGEISDDLIPETAAAEPVAVPEFLDESRRVNTNSLISHLPLDQPSFPAAFELRSQRDYASPRSVSWWRLEKPLVAGQPLTSFVRLATTADFLMSAGGLVGATQHVSINPDLTIYLHTLSNDPWIGIESVVRFDTNGIGVTDANLYDRTSHIGSASKSLLIFKR